MMKTLSCSRRGMSGEQNVLPPLPTTRIYFCSGLCTFSPAYLTADDVASYALMSQRQHRWPDEIPCPSCESSLFRSSTKEGRKLWALSGDLEDVDRQQAWLNAHTPRLDMILIGQEGIGRCIARVKKLGLSFKWGKEASEELADRQLAALGIHDGLGGPTSQPRTFHMISRGRTVDVTQRFFARRGA